MVALPYTTNILPGVHQVRLSVPGFETPDSNTEKVEIDQVTKTIFRLRPLNSSVVFTTNIKNSKVKVYANGKYLGRAGEEVFLPPFIKHDIRLTARGYRDGLWKVRLLKPGKKHPDIDIELRKAN